MFKGPLWFLQVYLCQVYCITMGPLQEQQNLKRYIFTFSEEKVSGACR